MPLDQIRSPRRALVFVGLAALLSSACVPVPGNGGEPPGGASSEVPASAEVSDATGCTDPRTSVLPGRPVAIERPTDAPVSPAAPDLTHADAEALRSGLILGGEGQACVDRIVLVTSDDAALRALAGTRAVIDGIPLLLGLEPDPVLLDRLSALDVQEIVVFGEVPDWAASDGRRVLRPAATHAGLLELALTLASDRATQMDEDDLGLVLVLEDDVAAQMDAVASAAAGPVPLVLPRDTTALQVLLDALEGAAMSDTGPAVSWAASTAAYARALDGLIDATDIPRWSAPSGSASVPELWLGDIGATDASLAAAVVAAARGAAFVAVDGADPRSGVTRTERLRAAHSHPEGPASVVYVGDITSSTAWQLDTVLTGATLPGGGFLPLEDRRIVALYGSPGAPSLGLLGAQDEAATIARAREVAARYEAAADGRTVVPGLDVIATIASSAAEPTGDFSRRVPISRLRPLIDLAADAGVAVFLDLQPGRTSFLVQAQEYEELLREPHVHLALDPEWRIGPGERHLVRIGSVAASEVQDVADWLADLVRTHRLPQKVLMLHQFTLAMLPDRDTVQIPAELIGVIHMDGQGALPLKDRTYAVLSDGAEGHWAWGWKNFTRIDVPVATPEQTIDRVPVPVVITYQ